MIRAFDWRDVALLKTLNGVCLDTATGLTRGHAPLPAALLEMWFPGQGSPTVIWHSNTPSPLAAFGQLRHPFGSELARVIYMAPPWDMAQEAWHSLLEHLCLEAGKRGAQNLIAEVDENSGEFETLRTVGFAVYTRQTVWQLKADTLRQTQLTSLRVRHSQDLLGVGLLYANVVPRLIQQVEPPPRRTRGYVLEKGGEIIAYLDVKRGPRGVWVDPYLHPEADTLAADVLRSGLRLISEANKNNRPVYVCVRRYQDWLQSVLEDVGCDMIGSQAVMVKRLVVRVKEPVLKSLPALEAVTPPVMRMKRHSSKK